MKFKFWSKTINFVRLVSSILCVKMQACSQFHTTSRQHKATNETPLKNFWFKTWTPVFYLNYFFKRFIFTFTVIFNVKIFLLYKTKKAPVLQYDLRIFKILHIPRTKITIKKLSYTSLIYVRMRYSMFSPIVIWTTSSELTSLHARLPCSSFSNRLKNINVNYEILSVHFLNVYNSNFHWNSLHPMNKVRSRWEVF